MRPLTAACWPAAYLDLARHIIAAQAWTQALELAAPDADWPSCARWTASTPFTDKIVLALLDTLGGDPEWQRAQHAATTAWQQLWDRADAGHAQARQAAGPPGLRAHAAAACAVVAAQQDTVIENELIAAIRGGPEWWKTPGWRWAGVLLPVTENADEGGVGGSP